MGGVENHVRAISHRLAESNEVHVLTTDPLNILPKEQLVEGVQIIRFRAFAPREAYHFSSGLRKYLKEHSEDYDIVHAHSYHDVPAYYAAISKAENKLVFTPHFHGTVGHTFFRNLLHVIYKPLFGRKIFIKADKVICHSNFERNMIRTAFGELKGKLQHIKEPPLLEDLQQLKFARSTNDNDKKTILCVSRIEKYKNIHYIIKALPLLPSFVQLQIVGRGPFKPELERLVKSLHLEGRVTFSQDLTEKEMLECYASADVGALLSCHESYGLFVAEALSSGIPCVVADKDALSEWIDGKNCIWVSYPIKLKEVAHAILSVLDGRVADVELPTLSAYVRKLQSLYSEACNY
jgi:glycosyltransferase involved in cell wall biosynthesis